MRSIDDGHYGTRSADPQRGKLHAPIEPFGRINSVTQPSIYPAPFFYPLLYIAELTDVDINARCLSDLHYNSMYVIFSTRAATIGPTIREF